MARAPRVAVIDDTKHVRQMLASMLALDGFEVAGEGASAADAVSIARDAKPDVMVIDYAMPGKTGLDAAAEIFEFSPGQKVILYTAYLDAEVAESARRLGVTACLSKVEGLETLEASIASICRDLN